MINKLFNRITTKWTKDKPDFPCLFATKHKYRSETCYDIFKLEYWVDEGYLGIFDATDGDEWGDLDDLTADEYFIIERFKWKIGKK